jgi:cytochrome c peroxidase
MATGVRADAETAVRAGMKFIEFSMRSEEDASSIDAYLSSIEPVPSPRLAGGKLSQSARRGEKIFRSAGCARCHPAPLFTDLRSYDVGTGIERDFGRSFDTPTLVEVWRTAPYLYDGRAATMKDVLTRYNVGDFHGITFGLSSEGLADLVEYILSL